MTAQEIFDIVMDLADERDPDTGLIDSDDTKDYNVRTPGILNSIQSTLLTDGRYTKTHTITRTKPLTSIASFDLLKHESEDVTREAIGNVYGYAFTATGTGIVYIEDYNGAWNTLATVNTVVDTEYKDAVTPSVGATKHRIRLSGTYVYGIINYALYRANYETVPSYGVKVKEDMPSDFISVDDVVSESFGEYTQNRPFSWENEDELWIDIEFEGIIKVTYYANPTTITSLTDTLELNDRILKTTVVYMLGMELFKEENDTLYGHFLMMYNDTLQKNKTPKFKGNSQMLNVYGGF